MSMGSLRGSCASPAYGRGAIIGRGAGTIASNQNVMLRVENRSVLLALDAHLARYFKTREASTCAHGTGIKMADTRLQDTRKMGSETLSTNVLSESRVVCPLGAVKNTTRLESESCVLSCLLVANTKFDHGSVSNKFSEKVDFPDKGTVKLTLEVSVRCASPLSCFDVGYPQ